MPKNYFILLFTSLLCSASHADVSIVTTIKPLQMIAEAVIQENGSVSSIVDPRQSPHHFTVSPSDRIALARADITVWIGPLFETQLSDFFAQSQAKEKTIQVIEIPGLRLHTIGESQIDAHLWLDSVNALQIATEIADRAAALDPTNAASYRENLQEFSLEIERRNQQVAQMFESPAVASYGVYHDAYQYFEQQFGLQHDLIVLEDPEVQPSIRQIVQLRSEVNEKKPACLLLESDASMELVNTVLDGHELKLISVDLLGSNVNTQVNAYSEFIAKVADDFYQCLYE
jgi:zinc transport system substrate-binding protein